MIKGIAYFKDGHTEVISRYRRHEYTPCIDFDIGAVQYIYTPAKVTLQSGYTCIRHVFVNAETWDNALIDHIVLL